MMSVESALKNLLPELQFLIFNGSSVPILGRLRCVCKKLSLCDRLKNLLDIHKDHARIRFEKVVYTAKPFFPRKMRNRNISEEINEMTNNPKCLIHITKKHIGEFYFMCEENVYWYCECFLPNRWTNFFRSHDGTRYKMNLHKHFKKTIYSFIASDIEHDVLFWDERQNIKYVNYAEAQTQFWAVFSIVHQWTPEDFFASTQMFF